MPPDGARQTATRAAEVHLDSCLLLAHPAWSRHGDLLHTGLTRAGRQQARRERIQAEIARLVEKQQRSSPYIAAGLQRRASVLSSRLRAVTAPPAHESDTSDDSGEEEIGRRLATSRPRSAGAKLQTVGWGGRAGLGVRVRQPASQQGSSQGNHDGHHQPEQLLSGVTVQARPRSATARSTGAPSATVPLLPSPPVSPPPGAGGTAAAYKLCTLRRHIVNAYGDGCTTLVAHSCDGYLSDRILAHWKGAQPGTGQRQKRARKRQLRRQRRFAASVARHRTADRGTHVFALLRGPMDHRAAEPVRENIMRQWAQELVLWVLLALQKVPSSADARSTRQHSQARLKPSTRFQLPRFVAFGASCRACLGGVESLRRSVHRAHPALIREEVKAADSLTKKTAELETATASLRKVAKMVEEAGGLVSQALPSAAEEQRRSAMQQLAAGSSAEMVAAKLQLLQSAQVSGRHRPNPAATRALHWCCPL
jgi:hypothetical protein